MVQWSPDAALAAASRPTGDPGGPWEVMNILSSLSGDPVALVEACDDTFRYSWIDTRAGERFGFPSHAIEGRLFPEVHTPDFIRAFALHAKSAVARNTPVRYEFRTEFPVGEITLEISISVLPSKTSQYYVATMRDVSARASEEAARIATEERLRAMMEPAPFIVWLIGHEGEVKFVSGAVQRILGFTPAEMMTKSSFELLHPEDVPRMQEFFGRVLTAQGQPMRTEMRTVRADGSIRWAECTVTNMLHDRRIEAIVVHAYDVTERRRIEAQTLEVATHDALTGLPNRTQIDARIEQRLRLVDAESNLRAAVAFVDLDGFKLINDTLGHAVGDEVLIEAARRLSEGLLSIGWVSRFGGDEFIVVADRLGTEADHAAMAQRILDLLAEPFVVSPHKVQLGGSIGIALGGGSTQDTPDSLMRHADLAMYEAKRSRRGVHFYDQSLQQQAQQRLELLTHLGSASSNDEFFVEYQPIVGLIDHRVVGVEALLRWRHPTLGSLSPKEFTSVAEETGAIVEIGEWTLNKTCETLAAWINDGLRVTGSVNVSPRQLVDTKFVDRVHAAVARAGIDPAQLILEITEDIIVDNPTQARAALQRLDDFGVRCAIDDFGRGYSSLAFLSRFPASILKIDGEFVRAMRGVDPKARTTGADPYALMVALVSMAHGLGMDLIAEGIEEPAELVALRSMGCRYGQGYLLGAPKEAQEIRSELLRPGRLGVLGGGRRR